MKPNPKSKTKGRSNKASPKREAPRGKYQPNNVKDDERLSDTGRNVHDSTVNDWRWYAMSPELVRDYGSLPFGYPLGSPVNLWGIPVTGDVAVAGIMALYFQPTVGVAKVESDGINVAMRRLFTEVRKANSGSTNYEAPDLLMYIIAMDSVAMYISYLRRLYGVIYDTTPLNRYYSKAVVNAMGVDYEDIVGHIADLRGFINLMIVKFNAMCIPNSFSYIARHSWMCEGLYTDSNTSKAQTYLYVPTDYYTFSQGTASNPGTKLVYKQFLNTDFVRYEFQTVANTCKSFQQLQTFGLDLLNPIIEDQAFNIMSGDVLKAFGPEGVLRLAGLPENYMVLPQHVPEVASQIENAWVYGRKLNNGTVNQATGIGEGYIQCEPQAEFAFYKTTESVTGYNVTGTSFGAFLGAPKLLNMHHDSVTPEEVMVATRLMCGVNGYKAGVIQHQLVANSSYEQSVYLTLSTLGSEYICAAKMYYYVGPGWGYNLNSLPWTSWGPGLVFQSGLPDPIAMWSQFDWAPIGYRVNVTSFADSKANLNVVPGTIYCDVDQYTLVTQNNIIQLNDAAIISEFWV